MERKYYDADYPAKRAYPFTDEELTVVWAAYIIDGQSDAVYYAEKNGAGEAPVPAKSNRVSRKNRGTDVTVTVHASERFFDAVEAWWPKAQAAINS